jgi:hypothetical protein
MTSPGDLRAQTRTARIAAPRLGEILISGKEGLHVDDALDCSCRVCQKGVYMRVWSLPIGNGDLSRPCRVGIFPFPLPFAFFI